MTADIQPKLDINRVISKEDAGWGDGAHNLACPTCAGTYNHVGAPYLKDGGDNYEAKWGGRGDLVVVPVSGECGSKWEVCIGFHKGESAIFARIHQSCNTK